MSSPSISSTQSVSTSLAWWQAARFGLSLHFGLYTVAARGEWVRSMERMGPEEYRAYFDSFNPEPGWATGWARLARESGAKYGVLTTKHHDGFCLFDSALTEFKATNTPARRDLVREWVDAMRAEGLGIGLYYSLVDWHHPDCPATGDRQHPLRHHPDSPARDASADWARYVDYFHGQILELCTNYGRIDQLVVDFSYWDYQGEKWGATEIQRKVRALQPHITFNDRWANEPRKRVPRPAYAGDYEQTEQNIPREGLRDDAGQPMPWEAWFTLTNSWSYSATDNLWKSPATIIRALVNCVSKDGNLLLNVCTDARGRVPGQAVATLQEIGEWLSLNGDSIYGAGAASAEFAKPEWGRYTQKGNTLYAHVLEQVIGNICLPGLRGRVKRARLIANNAEVIICDYWNPGIQTFDGPDDIFFNFAAPTAWTYPLPDSRDTVVSFDLTDEIDRLSERRRLEEALGRSLERKPIG
ncbi:alpha-L-fucosidase [Verrucomicrobia bacterium LW23]|nr:alpha-L-fucosidase [Verrucomicrobia bacterium LW23]